MLQSRLVFFQNIRYIKNRNFTANIYNKKQTTNDPVKLPDLFTITDSTYSGMKNSKSLSPNAGRNKTSFPGID